MTTKHEWISINHRLNSEFKPDPMLGAPEFKTEPELAPEAVERRFRDYMIPWYKDPRNDPT